MGGMEQPANADERVSQARNVLAQLPPSLGEASLVCPLCSSPAAARGLIARTNNDPEQPAWFVAFTCPSCGLLTTFEEQQLNLQQLAAFDDSAWTEKLRRFLATAPQATRVPQERMALPHQMIGLFVVCLVIWLLLVGSFDLLVIGWGVVVSLVIARVSYRLIAFDIPVTLLHPRRWLQLLGILLELTRQLIVQNITLSIRVLRPSLPIRPGIVAVPTVLKGDLELTVLGSLLSLTPDTVTMEIDQAKGIIYTHWIDVKTTVPTEAKEILVTALERRVKGRE